MHGTTWVMEGDWQQTSRCFNSDWWRDLELHFHPILWDSRVWDCIQRKSWCKGPYAGADFNSPYLIIMSNPVPTPELTLTPRCIYDYEFRLWNSYIQWEIVFWCRTCWKNDIRSSRCTSSVIDIGGEWKEIFNQKSVKYFVWTTSGK